MGVACEAFLMSMLNYDLNERRCRGSEYVRSSACYSGVSGVDPVECKKMEEEAARLVESSRVETEYALEKETGRTQYRTSG